MTRREAFAAQLRRDRVLAIVRADEGVDDIVHALWAGGIHLVEISLTGRDALAAVERLGRSVEPGRLLGAGTVLDVGSAGRAVDAGATFLVSPVVDVQLIAWAAQADVPHLAGALTPTDVHAAGAAGAGPVKLFPASLGGPAYVRALREPFPQAELVPTGGVSPADVEAYLQAGAVAVALGSSLVRTSHPAGVEGAAREVVQAIAAMRPPG